MDVTIHLNTFGAIVAIACILILIVRK